MALASPTMGLPLKSLVLIVFGTQKIDASASIKAPPHHGTMEVFIMPSLALERSH